MHALRKIAAPALGGLLAACGLSLAGCGGAAPPVRAQSDASAALRAAQEVGAERTPQAAYHVELAREQMRAAETLIERGEMDDASRALMRAKADAELAISLSRESEARQGVEQTRGHIEALERGLD